MLTQNDIKEQLSYAYVHTVASLAGFGCERPMVDRDSVDVTIVSRGRLTPESTFASPRLDLQLKATVHAPLLTETFKFDLKRKNYDDLRLDSPHVPRILVVLLLPEEATTWLMQDEEGLTLRRCAYWHSLRGLPAISNATTKTITLSRQNIFTPESLRALMVRISYRKDIENE